MEQNNVSPEKKDSIMKSLAIAGFVGILLLVAWLAVQLVHLFPTAFNSLASLAEGVNQYQETVLDTTPDTIPLTVTANTSLLNTGEDITINWSDVRAAGSYVFAYDCVEGVSVTHMSDLGERVIDCDTNYNIGDTNTLTVSIESEKNRYADVPYTLAFLRTDDTAPRAMGDNVVTIVNTDVDSRFAVARDDSEPAEPIVQATSDAVTDTPADTTALAVATQTTTPEPFTQELAFTIPVSDPDGQTDLGTTFLGMGEIINGAFVAGPVSVNNPGAIQFSVRNVGNKTSRDWVYRVALPNGETFVSEEQAELKPNERAVITIGFPAGANTPHTFIVSVDEQTDRNASNDGFRQVIVFAE